MHWLKITLMIYCLSFWGSDTHDWPTYRVQLRVSQEVPGPSPRTAILGGWTVSRPVSKVANPPGQRGGPEAPLLLQWVLSAGPCVRLHGMGARLSRALNHQAPMSHSAWPQKAWPLLPLSEYDGSHRATLSQCGRDEGTNASRRLQTSGGQREGWLL